MGEISTTETTDYNFKDLRVGDKMKHENDVYTISNIYFGHLALNSDKCKMIGTFEELKNGKFKLIKNMEKTKTSDYTIEDLVKGAELKNERKVIRIEGNIGRVYLSICNENDSYLHTIEELKKYGYQLIKPTKMNGEFEVKKYEKPYPIVKCVDSEDDICYRHLVEVTEKNMMTLYWGNDPSPSGFNYKYFKIEGQKY